MYIINKMQANINIPAGYKCPISFDVMENPVTTSDGQTYDRSSIEPWLATHDTSPLTNLRLANKNLTPNYALKTAIDEWKIYKSGTNGGAGSSSSSSNSSSSSSSTSSSSDDPVAPSIASIPPTFDFEMKSTVYNGETLVHIKVHPPVYSSRKPVAISAGVDTSGSMSYPAVVKVENSEFDGYSRLDFVKHSLNTIVNSLGADDVFGLSRFSTHGSVVLTPKKMNADGKLLALSAIASLQPDGQTNLYSGLIKALDQFKDPMVKDMNKSICIFTDGESNINPPKGFITEYTDYLRKNENINVHTFGYGSALDVKLLNEISDKSFGTYNYISTIDMIGTVFVNFTAYMLSTVSTNNTLKITAGGSTELLNVYGYTSNEIHIGNLQFGQSRDFVVRIKPGSAPYLNVELNVNGTRVQKDLTVISAEPNEEILVEYARLRFVERLQEVLETSLLTAQRIITELHAELSALPVGTKLKNFLNDIRSAATYEGQIEKAFTSLNNFNKWGQYYIPSIRKANLLQYCNNFKDKTVQVYGGRMFQEMQDNANIIFNNLTPPPQSIKPEVATYSANSYSGAGSVASFAPYVPPPPPSNFANANDNRGGCFGGMSSVKMADNTICLVKNIKVDDLVFTPTGPAKVVCSIKIKVVGGNMDLVEIGDLLITPYHPVKQNDKWVFPKYYKGGIFDLHSIDYVYNFVLDSGHIIDVNGVECCTLGHEFKGDVIEHEYFGKNIINDLKVMPGWNEGNIYVDKAEYTYDQRTGMVNGWHLV